MTITRYSEFIEGQPLDNSRVLILNADYRPLSYLPLSTWSWQETVKAIFRETVDVVSEYDDLLVRAPNLEMKLPSVIALREYVKPQEKPAFTRFNLFLRDVFHCQYCAESHKTSELTFDHVIPRSRGGETSWDNIVAACRPCNTRKGHQLPREIGMHPMTTPRTPTLYELQETGRRFPPNFLHESWGDFLYWDTELTS